MHVFYAGVFSRCSRNDTRVRLPLLKMDVLFSRLTKKALEKKGHRTWIGISTVEAPEFKTRFKPKLPVIVETLPVKHRRKGRTVAHGHGLPHVRGKGRPCTFSMLAFSPAVPATIPAFGFLS